MRVVVSKVGFEIVRVKFEGSGVDFEGVFNVV